MSRDSIQPLVGVGKPGATTCMKYDTEEYLLGNFDLNLPSQLVRICQSSLILKRVESRPVVAEGGDGLLLTPAPGVTGSSQRSWTHNCNAQRLPSSKVQHRSLQIAYIYIKICQFSTVESIGHMLCDPNSRRWKGNVPPTNGQGCTTYEIEFVI
eukprot:scaffold15735_cov161-Skeletonema_dohrnii-CCMP3373.AAC.1